MKPDIELELPKLDNTIDLVTELMSIGVGSYKESSGVRVHRTSCTEFSVKYDPEVLKTNLEMTIHE